MSQKNLDCKDRWRNLTIAFRVSPEENEAINVRARLSGLTKQEYLSRRCQEQEVVVMGNPRVYKALKEQMELILRELRRISPEGSADPDLLETIRAVAATFGSMNANDNDKG